MITDDMLIAATQEVSLCMVDCITETSHSFSAQFERRIRALNRRADHPVIYRIVRSAAAVVLAIITVFGAVLALSPQVRAAVIGWVRSTFESYFHYSIEETQPADVQYEYCLPEAFEGYSLLTTWKEGSGGTYIYTNESGQMLQFVYFQGSDSADLFLNVEYCTHEVGTICGYPADIYVSPEADLNSSVVWSDGENNLLCCLCVCADRENLIQIAEKIESFKIISE